MLLLMVGLYIVMDNEFIIKIGVQQTTILEDIKDIKAKVDNLPCAVHDNKIGMLQKVVYGAVGIILIAWMVNINSADKVKAKSIKNKKTNIQYELIYPAIPKVKYIRADND